MDYKNHLKTGVMTGVIFITSIYTHRSIEPQDIVMYSAGIVVGSALPDIDHSRSYIAKKLNFVGWIVSRMFSHRGFTHSILFIFLLNIIREVFKGIISSEYSSLFNYTMLGITVSAATHIFMDLFVGNGVKLFFPIDKKISISKMKAGSAFENVFIKAVLIVFCLAILFYHGKQI